MLTSMPLLNNVLSDLRASEEAKGMCSLYFTKESHIHTLLNLVLSSDLPIVMPQMPPLDYFSSITFEVYERITSRGYASSVPSASASAPQSPRAGSAALGPAVSSERSSSSTPAPHSMALNGAGAAPGTAGGRQSPNKAERSLIITVSEGAHSSNILSINLDARHALAPLPRRPLTSHVDFDEALHKLGSHKLVGDTDRGQIEGDAVYFGGEDADRHLLPVKTKQRRGSLDTDQSSIRGVLRNL